MGTSLFNSPLFVTIICLILVFAMLSLLVSTITEAINSYFKERGILLYNTIANLFDDNVNVNFGQLLYAHPMIDNLKKDKKSLPQYISAEMFSNALIDVVVNYSREFKFNAAANAIQMTENHLTIFQRYRSGIDMMKHTTLKLLLLNMVEKCEGQTGDSLNLLQKQLTQWYNDQMERTSGWYKTYVRTRLFWISLLVAVALNVDSIRLFQSLYRSPDARNLIEPIAEMVADNYATAKLDSSKTALQDAYQAIQLTHFPTDSAGQNDSSLLPVKKALAQWKHTDSLLFKADSARQNALANAATELDQFSSLGLPVGWSRRVPPLSWWQKQPAARLQKGFSGWSLVSYLLGLLITAFSISAGAPFWFDLLLRFVNIRRAGLKPPTDKN
jgi:hypothetical protein